MTFIWIAIFIISLAALLKGGDWLLKSAERIGYAFGLSTFAVGVIIVAFGTSLPELFASFAAVIQGVPEIVTANAVGSNVANILLVVGISAVAGVRLMVARDLINLELPLLATSTALFLAAAWDGSIVPLEAMLLFLAYIIYLGYALLHDEETGGIINLLRRRSAKKAAEEVVDKEQLETPLSINDGVMFLIGAGALVVGAKFLVDSVIALSQIFAIAPTVITMTAVALGTSLPELVVSAKAAWRSQSDIALGNIFGSNVFNLLVVVGLPGLFTTLPVNGQTGTVGLVALIVATVLFLISGISRRIHLWEGCFYLLLYFMFAAKLFELF